MVTTVIVGGCCYPSVTESWRSFSSTVLQEADWLTLYSSWDQETLANPQFTTSFVERILVWHIYPQNPHFSGCYKPSANGRFMALGFPYLPMWTWYPVQIHLSIAFELIGQRKVGRITRPPSRMIPKIQRQTRRGFSPYYDPSSWGSGMGCKEWFDILSIDWNDPGDLEIASDVQGDLKVFSWIIGSLNIWRYFLFFFYGVFCCPHPVTRWKRFAAALALFTWFRSCVGCSKSSWVALVAAIAAIAGCSP